MFRFLILATALSASMADDLDNPQIMIHNDYHRQESHRLRQDLEQLRQALHVPSNPNRHLIEMYRENPHDLGHRRDEYDDRRENYDRREKYDDRRNDWEHRHERPEKQWWTDKDKIEHVDDDEDIKGPVILRTIKSHNDPHKPDIARQNEIIEEVYSPDYAPPTWVIDYRYLKTGGRDYTRGPGGQIIILPKGIRTNEHKKYKNYDELIEYLRQKNLAERKKPQYFMPLGQEVNKRDDDWLNNKDVY